MKVKHYRRWTAFNGASLLLLGLLASCQHLNKTEVTAHNYPCEDKEYCDALKQVTRQAQVFHNFETEFFITATYLSQAFRNSFITRQNAMLGEHHFVKTSLSEKNAFFVSVYAPNRELNKLSDSELWQITLDCGGQIHHPTIQEIKPKIRWQSFFPFINQWSQEYLVTFDAKDVPDSAQPFTLHISNVRGKVKMVW